MARNWGTLAELAASLIERGKAGRRVVLSPQTAYLIGIKLQTADAKPERDEIALMICRRGQAELCSEPCFECMGRANIVVRAYGQKSPARDDISRQA